MNITSFSKFGSLKTTKGKMSGHYNEALDWSTFLLWLAAEDESFGQPSELLLIKTSVHHQKRPFNMNEL
jgi:hypothetical protein